MKKHLVPILVLGAALLTASSCKKLVDKLIPAFDTSVNGITVDIPIVPYTASQVTFGQNVYFNLDSVIKARTAGVFGVGDVTSLKVKNISVNLTNSDALNDMSNFESATVQFSSNTNTTPVTIASVTIPDTPSSTLSIDTSNSPDIKSYFSGNQFSFTITGQARRPTTHDLNAVVSVTLSIK